MIDPSNQVEMFQTITEAWQRILSAQIAETEKWHGKYMDLLKEKIADQHKAFEEFAR